MSFGKVQDSKVVVLLAPIGIDDAAATSLACDCLGFHWATVLFVTGLTDDASYDSLSLEECDTSGGSYTAITGSGHTAPITTQDGLVWRWDLDLRKRKRYLKAVIDPGDGTADSLASCVAILSVPDIEPQSAADLGVVARIIL